MPDRAAVAAAAAPAALAPAVAPRRERWEWSIAPGAAPSLEPWGIDGGSPPPLADAQTIGRNEGREVRRLVDPAGRRPTLYLKWFSPRRARLARKEQHRLESLRARGLPAPPPLARAVGPDGAALLVLGELPGLPADEWMAAANPAERRRGIVELGRALADLHTRGVEHRQLFAWHVVIGADGGTDDRIDAASVRIGWLDVGGASLRGRAVQPRARAADLAALLATLPRASFSLADRARLLRAYEPSRERRRDLVARIRPARLRLLRRARVPRDGAHREWRTAAERVLVIEPWVGEAVLAGWTEASAWLEPGGAEVVRTRDGRANLVWPRAGGDAARAWFGKRFDHAPWRGRAPAFREWIALRALASIGIPVPRIVAVARRERGPSVLWTEGVVPGTSLRERLAALAPAGRHAAQRRRLFAEAAAIARRLHAAGFLHRDLYLDHLLLERSDGRERLVLIDATRVAAFARLPARGRIKDLAALEFSARAAGASRAERWRALLVYARGDRRLARALATKALRKADRIARRERRHGRAAPLA